MLPKGRNKVLYSTSNNNPIRGFRDKFDSITNVIAPEPGGFVKFMKSRGKLGGQNKIPRLANERTYANELANFVVDFD